MSCWSYYQAATIKNDLIQRPPPAPDTRDIDPIYKVKKKEEFQINYPRIQSHAKFVINGSLSELIIARFAKNVC